MSVCYVNAFIYRDVKINNCIQCSVLFITKLHVAICTLTRRASPWLVWCITSATISSWDGEDDIKIVANNWTQALSHADNGVFSTNTMMCFTHGVETALTFHAGNGDRMGILCSKCYKFFRWGAFTKHMLGIAWMLFHPAIVWLKSLMTVRICGQI